MEPCGSIARSAAAYECFMVKSVYSIARAAANRTDIVIEIIIPVASYTAICAGFVIVIIYAVTRTPAKNTNAVINTFSVTLYPTVCATSVYNKTSVTNFGIANIANHVDPCGSITYRAADCAGCMIVIIYTVTNSAAKFASKVVDCPGSGSDSITKCPTV